MPSFIVKKGIIRKFLDFKTTETAIFVISLTLLGRALVIVNKSWKQRKSARRKSLGLMKQNATTT